MLPRKTLAPCITPRNLYLCVGGPTFQSTCIVDCSDCLQLHIPRMVCPRESRTVATLAGVGIPAVAAESFLGNTDVVVAFFTILCLVAVLLGFGITYAFGEWSDAANARGLAVAQRGCGSACAQSLRPGSSLFAAPDHIISHYATRPLLALWCSLISS